MIQHRRPEPHRSKSRRIKNEYENGYWTRVLSTVARAPALSKVPGMDRTRQRTALYGRNSKTVDPGVCKTWMDRFTELEPDGGFRTVDLMWHRNGHIGTLEPVLSTAACAPELSKVAGMDTARQEAALYGKNGKTADPDVLKTWMDRFTELEPDEGFRTVHLMWQRRSIGTFAAQ